MSHLEKIIVAPLRNVIPHRFWFGPHATNANQIWDSFDISLFRTLGADQCTKPYCTSVMKAVTQGTQFTQRCLGRAQ